MTWLPSRLYPRPEVRGFTLPKIKRERDSKVQVRIFKDKNSLGRAVAEQAASCLHNAIGESGHARNCGGDSQFEFLDASTGRSDLVVPDEKKARAIKSCFEGPITPLAPASILSTHRNATAFLDKNSAALLNPQMTRVV